MLLNRASHGNLTVLEHILSHDECDVDPINRLEKATPLHLALRIQDEETRQSVVESLLEAGADTTYVLPSWHPLTQSVHRTCRIKDKNGETAVDLLRDDDTEIRQLMRKARAQNSVSRGDIANGTRHASGLIGTYARADDESGSGSGSGSDED